MKALATLTFVLVGFCLIAPAQTQEKKPDEKVDGITFKMDYLEKTYNLKFKSAKVTKDSGVGTIAITLEFTKDCPNVAEFAKQLLSQGNKEPCIRFYCIDEDNIAQFKIADPSVEGMITGVASDAIRLHLKIGSLDKIKKIEARQDNPPK